MNPKLTAILVLLMLAPALVHLVWWIGIPVVATFVLAFTDYDILNPPEWTGLENFQRMIHDEQFWASVKVTLVYVLISVPLQLGFALLLALEATMIGVFSAGSVGAVAALNVVDELTPHAATASTNGKRARRFIG